jgi:hypothetical protein
MRCLAVFPKFLTCTASLTALRLVYRLRRTRHVGDPGPRTEPVARDLSDVRCTLHQPSPPLRQLLPHQTSHGLTHAAMPPRNIAQSRTTALDRLTSRHHVPLRACPWIAAGSPLLLHAMAQGLSTHCGVVASTIALHAQP